MKTLVKLGKEFNAHSGAAPGLYSGLRRAQAELEEALEARTREEMEEEIADVILTLASLSASCRMDIDAVIERKHAINMRRKWKADPTFLGGVQHVEEDDDE